MWRDIASDSIDGISSNVVAKQYDGFEPNGQRSPKHALVRPDDVGFQEDNPTTARKPVISPVMNIILEAVMDMPAHDWVVSLAVFSPGYPIVQRL